VAKPYDWSQFTQRIEIKAPPSKVFKSWTDAAEIVRWFTVKAVIEPRKGGRLYFEWLAGDKLDTRIVRIRKPSLLVFPFGGGKEEVSVKIRKSGRVSLVELHQYGMKTTPTQKVSMHLGCQVGWTFFLANLKAWLEHGIDLRSHNPKKSYKQGYIDS
jgi:uncharacterized protein YndB with AHSA1/START domain